MSTPEIVASLMGAYASGWAWGAIALFFKRLSEVST